MRVRDVVVCVTDSAITVAPDEYREHIPVGTPDRPYFQGSPPVPLGRDVVLGRLSDDEAELVLNACSPRGHFFVPVRQFGQRCSFIREIPLLEGQQHGSNWDPDGILWDALALSRLIRDNAYSTQYAARIADHEDGQQTVSYTLGAESKHVYRLRRDRDWLDHQEAEELRDLLGFYWATNEDLPRRVTRASWRAEYASWVKWGDLVVPTLASGLEALLKTERHGSTSQFTTRVPALAESLSIDGITPELCERMYDARSEWVHGAHVRLFTTGREAQERGGAQGPQNDEQWNAFTDIARLQDLLRAAVRKCFSDEDFRAIFEDDDSIRRTFAEA